jgi:hypothetical protein
MGISNLVINDKSTTATFTWDTDVVATTELQLGVTAPIWQPSGLPSVGSGTHHTYYVSGLNAGTSYTVMPVGFDGSSYLEPDDEDGFPAVFVTSNQLSLIGLNVDVTATDRATVSCGVVGLDDPETITDVYASYGPTSSYGSRVDGSYANGMFTVIIPTPGPLHMEIVVETETHDTATTGDVSVPAPAPAPSQGQVNARKNYNTYQQDFNIYATIYRQSGGIR